MPTIKSWPESERPRERLLKSGPQSLSDAELVAILIRNGSAGKDALALARELLQSSAGLRGLFHLSPSKLKTIKGLGAAKIAGILAVKELATRYLKEETLEKDVIRDPESVAAYLSASLRDQKIEVFKVLFLDKGNRILDCLDLFRGTVDQAAVYPREIVKAALEHHATAVILVHNHPSGRAEPSAEDREVTKKISLACQSVNIRVLDHIIIGDNQRFSFSEHGLV